MEKPPQAVSSLKPVVLVGHCGPDMHLLKSVVGRALPGVKISVANDAGSLEPHLSAGALLLVNRVLAGDFGTDSGVELIGQIHARKTPATAMLISNHDDAQAEAIGFGALPGFGKSQLYSDQTLRRLREATAEIVQQSGR